MGRAQGRVKDLFSSVFGEARGLRPDEESLSTAPPGPKAPRKKGKRATQEEMFWRTLSRRRWGLVKHMIEQQEQLDKRSKNLLAEPYALTLGSASMIGSLYATKDGRGIELDMHHRGMEAYSDLTHLEKEGILQEGETEDSKTSWKLRPPEIWPDKMRLAYRRWLSGGAPK